MPRALWKGSISFGLVSIPVGLVTVTESERIDLDMIDERDHARIQYKKVNANTGREVPKEKIVKGYAFTKGEYVIIEAKDFKRANPKATQTIDIESFVDLEEVDVTYFDRPYLLQALKGGEKAYSLLRETLNKTGKIGIAKVVIRTKQYLAAVIPQGELLILELLRFSHELRDPKQLHVTAPKAKVSAPEIRMAENLVKSMTEKWQPKKYKDTYYDDLKRLIAKKVKAGDTATVEEPDEESKVSDTGRVLDLMPLLKQSLKGKSEYSPKKKAPKKMTRKKRAVKRGA